MKNSDKDFFWSDKNAKAKATRTQKISKQEGQESREESTRTECNNSVQHNGWLSLGVATEMQSQMQEKKIENEKMCVKCADEEDSQFWNQNKQTMREGWKRWKKIKKIWIEVKMSEDLFFFQKHVNKFEWKSAKKDFREPGHTHMQKTGKGNFMVSAEGKRRQLTSARPVLSPAIHRPWRRNSLWHVVWRDVICVRMEKDGVIQLRENAVMTMPVSSKRHLLPLPRNHCKILTQQIHCVLLPHFFVRHQRQSWGIWRIQCDAVMRWWLWCRDKLSGPTVVLSVSLPDSAGVSEPLRLFVCFFNLGVSDNTTGFKHFFYSRAWFTGNSWNEGPARVKCLTTYCHGHNTVTNGSKIFAELWNQTEKKKKISSLLGPDQKLQSDINLLF